MRAFVAGGSEPIEVEVPQPAPGQVRVKVAAAGINPVDLYTAGGGFAEVIGERDHIGLGWDVAGTVDALGPDAGDLAVGTPVIGLRDRLAVSTGTHAEYVVLDTSAVAPAPGLDLYRAAALPLNGVTVRQALDLLDLATGETLLVTGAAGGVGVLAVRLAERRGLRVIRAVRPGTAGDVETGPGWPDAVRRLVPGGVAAVLDAAALGDAALDAVRGGGQYLSLLPGMPLPAQVRGVSRRAMGAYADAEALGELVKLAASGELDLPEVERYPLDRAADAYRRSAEPGKKTRVVLVP